MKIVRMRQFFAKFKWLNFRKSTIRKQIENEILAPRPDNACFASMEKESNVTAEISSNCNIDSEKSFPYQIDKIIPQSVLAAAPFLQINQNNEKIERISCESCISISAVDGNSREHDTQDKSRKIPRDVIYYVIFYIRWVDKFIRELFIFAHHLDLEHMSKDKYRQWCLNNACPNSTELHSVLKHTKLSPEIIYLDKLIQVWHVQFYIGDLFHMVDFGYVFGVEISSLSSLNLLNMVNKFDQLLKYKNVRQFYYHQRNRETKPRQLKLQRHKAVTCDSVKYRQ